MLLAIAGVSACSVAGRAAAPPPVTVSPSENPSQSPGAVPSEGTPSPTPSPSGTEKPSAPPFSAQVTKVTRDQVRYSWRPGCPVEVSDLRMITMPHWGFDGKIHTGRLVVNKDVADDVVSVFKKLYGYRFPIRKMEPVDAYKGSDYDSIDAGNTSAFNCRSATGSTSWSEHAYGRALDLNPRENPYIYADGSNAHRNADAYVKRPLHKPGVINPGDRVVRAFAAIGWGWGGYWSGAKDLQHFSKSGR